MDHVEPQRCCVVGLRLGGPRPRAVNVRVTRVTYSWLRYHQNDCTVTHAVCRPMLSRRWRQINGKHYAELRGGTILAGRGYVTQRVIVPQVHKPQLVRTAADSSYCQLFGAALCCFANHTSRYSATRLTGKASAGAEAGCGVCIGIEERTPPATRKQSQTCRILRATRDLRNLSICQSRHMRQVGM